MANTLKFKRGLVATIPTAALGEPLFTTDTFDLYIGNGTGNTRFQKYIASGATTQILRGDGSLYTFPLAISSPSAGQVLKYNGTNWVNDSDAGITGSGSVGQVAFFNGTSNLTGSNSLFWDATNSRLGVGTNTPGNDRLSVVGTGRFTQGLTSSTAFQQFAHYFYNGGGTNDIFASTTGNNAGSGNFAIVNTTNGGRLALLGASDSTIRMGNNTQTAATATNFVLHLATGNISINSATDNGLRFQVTGDGYFSGSVGIGTSTLTAVSLAVHRNITGSAFAVSVRSQGLVQSDVTNTGYGFYAATGTQATTFTLPRIIQFESDAGSFGAGSTVSEHFGFRANNISAANVTTAYGFYGNIASGTGRWNLYMNGTANNYMAGSLGIGTTSISGNNLAVIKNITGGTTAFNIQSAGVIQSDVTGYASYYRAVASTQATTFTLSTLVNFSSGTGAFGAGSTTTNFIGFHAQPMTGGVNNYGFYGEVESGTGRWNLYMPGSAHNYLANNLGINNTTPLTKLHISAGHIFANNGTGVSGGANIYLGSNDFNNSTFWNSAPGIGAVYSATSGVASDLGFYTYAGNPNSRTERARIFYTGNIGINTTTDAGFRLDVNGTMRVSGASTFSSSVTATNLTLTDAGGGIINNNTGNLFFQKPTSGGFIFRNGSPSFTEYMRLDSTGNLGIGTTTPAVRLEVAGTGTQQVRVTSTSGADMRINADTVGRVGTYSNSNLAIVTNGVAVGTFFTTGNLSLNSVVDAGFRLDVNGTMRVSGASTFNANMTLRLDQNAQTKFTITNNTTGTSSQARLDFVNNVASGRVFGIGYNSDTTTPYKILNSEDAFIYYNGLNDIAILNDRSTGSIKMAAGGSSTAHFTIASTGAATFSSSVTCSSLVVDSTTLVVDATNNRVGVNTNVPTSSLHVVGSVTKSHTTKTANYTMTESDYTVLCDTSGGGFTISLPAASGCSGRIYVIKKITGNSGTNNITIDPNGSETIDGSTTYTLQCRSSVMIQSNGANWWILAERVDNSCI